MINISIKGLHMPLTEALKDYTNTKLASLETFVKSGAYLHAEIGKPSSHHKGGEDVFQAEFTLDAAGQTYFVQVAEGDLYKAIDRAAADLIDMVKQGKGKRQTLLKKGRTMLKELARKGFYGWNKK